MANVSAFSGAQPITPGGLVELGYSQITSAVTVNNATAGTGVEVIAPLTVVCDGGPVLVEFFSSAARPSQTQAGDQLAISLFQDGSEKERLWGLSVAPAAGDVAAPVHLQYRTTPSAGAHTFGVRSYVVGSAARTGYIGAGTGGAASAFPPAFLRVSKIVQQNDGLKPFWTPPVVTQLPIQATVGDQVIYAADATNGVYWNLYYDGLGTYPWKFVGGAPLYAQGASSYAAITSTTYVDAGASMTLPLAGDYEIRMDAQIQMPAANASVTYTSIATNSFAASDYIGPIAFANATSSVDHGGSKATRFTVTAGEVAKIRARVSTGTGYVGFTRLIATPVRVKAA